MKDLTTKEGRIAEIQKIKERFLSELRQEGIEVAPYATCQIEQSCVVLGVENANSKNMAFGSDVTLYTYRHGFVFEREPEISYGTSGSFNPDNRASYWRTIHAASILKNWKTAITIVDDACEAYKLILEEFEKIDLKVDQDESKT